AFVREESLKYETIARQAAANQSEKKGAWTWNGNDFHAALNCFAHDFVAGIGDKRCAGVGNKRDRQILRRRFRERIQAPIFVVVVATHESFAQAEMTHQLDRDARILRQHELRVGERLRRPGGYVPQIADRCANDIELARHLFSMYETQLLNAR